MSAYAKIEPNFPLWLLNISVCKNQFFHTDCLKYPHEKIRIFSHTRHLTHPFTKILTEDTLSLLFSTHLSPITPTPLPPLLALSLSLPTSYPFSSLSAVGSGGGQVRQRKLPPLPSPLSRQRWRARAAGEGGGGARRPMATTLHPRSSGTGGGGGATMVEPAVGRCGRPTPARRRRIG